MHQLKVSSEFNKDNLLVFETHFWRVTHRRDSRYPGYLIASSLCKGCELSELEEGALKELGGVLAKAEGVLLKAFAPYKVIVAKLGFSKGFSCHFHLIPATANLMNEISSHPACGSAQGVSLGMMKRDPSIA